MTRKILLDCDPGHDDAVAILLAGACEDIRVLGITTVSGNQTLEKTTRNALRVVQHLGLDIPVYAGCDRPMVRERIICASIHGKSGLDGFAFAPLKRRVEKEHAVSFLIRTLKETKEPLTVVTTGPMTNLAMAVRLDPEIVPKIERIVLMGGSIGAGNMTAAAEFNILADAEAASVCFGLGRPVTMIGLDVTRKVLCVPEIIRRMEMPGNRAADLFTGLMTFFRNTQKKLFGLEGGPLHDPVTIAYLTRPELIRTEPMSVQIDIRSEQSYGRTNCSKADPPRTFANADVAVDIDVAGFWDLIEEGIRYYA